MNGSENQQRPGVKIFCEILLLLLPGVFVCKASNQGRRSPRSSACDLVGLHNLAFGYWIKRTEADRFTVAPN